MDLVIELRSCTGHARKEPTTVDGRQRLTTQTPNPDSSRSQRLSTFSRTLGKARPISNPTAVSSVVWMALLGDASHALKPLFAAYDALRREGDEWLDEALAEFPDPAQLRRDFEGVQRGNIYAVAACIAVLADNIARFYATRVFGDEKKARDFGSDIKGVPFGEILRVAGNAARHVPISGETSITTLEIVGIQRRDDAVPFELLELAGVQTMDELINELDIFAHQIEYEKFLETYDPSNPPKLEPWMMPSTGVPLASGRPPAGRSVELEE